MQDMNKETAFPDSVKNAINTLMQYAKAHQDNIGLICTITQQSDVKSEKLHTAHCFVGTPPHLVGAMYNALMGNPILCPVFRVALDEAEKNLADSDQDEILKKFGCIGNA